VAKLHGLWDFVLPTSDEENEKEALPVSTRSIGHVDSSQIIQK